MATKNLPLGTAVGTGTLMLPQFSPGMLLQSDDLSALGAYSRDLSRLLFRTLFGCGVICGLKVTTLWKCDKLTVTIDPGVALDCCGDPIQVTTTQSITIDSQCDPTFPKKLYVVLCEKNKCCAPRPAMCASDSGDSTSVCTREKYGFEIRVVKDRPDCACGCPDSDMAPLKSSACQCADPTSDCYKDHYQGACGCDCCGSGNDCTCNCDCVLLARLVYDGSQDADPTAWAVTHRVRRFVRPVLIEDPLALAEEAAANQALKKKKEKAAALGQGAAAVARPAESSAALALATQERVARVRTAELRAAESRKSEARTAEIRAAEARAAEERADAALKAEGHGAQPHAPAPTRSPKRQR